MSFFARIPFPSSRLASNDPSSPDFELAIPDLPHGLEKTQHILDLDHLRWALWALLALLVLLLLYRWLRKRPSSGPSKVTQMRKFGKKRPVPMPEIALRISKLRDRHLTAGTFRQGCHELAELLRGFYESLWSEPLTTRTVREIQTAGATRLGQEDGGAPGRLFGLLEGLQFSRRDPTADDLASVCDLAADVTSIYDGTLIADRTPIYDGALIYDETVARNHERNLRGKS